MKRMIERGDTIVEVVLAFTIFAVAAIGTIVLINSGLAATQRNLETTLVRQQIDSQGEIIRYLRETNNATWQNLIDVNNLVGTPYELTASCQEVSALGPAKAFYIVPNAQADIETTTFQRIAVAASNFAKPATYAKVTYGGASARSEGVWIQATQADTNGPIKAYDFYIHACWESVGVNVPMTLGTIVRVYE